MNKTKIEIFQKDALEDYQRSLIIEKITDVLLKKETDGSFTQIAVRPLVEEEMFVSPNFDSRLSGIGRIIAVGERDFLINTLVNDTRIKIKKIKKDSITLSTLLSEISEFNSKIIMPGDIEMSLIKSNEWFQFITYTDSRIMFNRFYELFLVPEKVLKNKIIILTEYSINWFKQVFLNEFTKREEKLDISLGNIRKNGKIDIIVRSLNKIEYLPEDIKIIELID